MTNLKGWTFAHHHDILIYPLLKSGEAKKVKENGKEKNLKEDIAKRGENFHNFGHCASKELDTNGEWVTLRDQSTFNISCRDSFFGNKINGSANALQWKLVRIKSIKENLSHFEVLWSITRYFISSAQNRTQKIFTQREGWLRQI